MVDKEKIYFFRHYVMPVALSWMANDTYGSVGEQDRGDFEKDFNEILDLALIGLKYKAQLSQEGTTKGTPYLKEYATADPDTAIGGLREMGDNLLREIHSRAMSRMGDCISRKDAIRWIKTECNPYGKPTLDFESGKRVMKHLEQMPSVQPEPKEGHWIWVAGELMCSECHTIFTDLYPDYDNSVACPHCGADMRGTKVKCGDEDTLQGGLMSAT